MDLNLALKTAQKACDAAREIQTRRFGGPLTVSDKGFDGLVSEADVLSEKTIKEILSADFPEIPFYGEEETFTGRGSLRATSWVVDPLDGTTNYIYGLPIYCISIGLQVEGRVMMGVVDVPPLGRQYTAIKGEGAFLNGRRLKVSTRTQVADALLATGFHPGDKKILQHQLQIFSKLVEESRAVRRAGAAALDLCLVAEGVFDAFWEAHLKPWDVAAGSLMVREAGGSVCTYEGKDFHIEDASVIASSPQMMPFIRARI